MKTKVLGELSFRRFLKDYWQKKPLLIRNAFPHFKGILTKKELISLSFCEDAQSRLVHLNRKEWSLQNGPFNKKDFTKLPAHWTLLVQGVNHFLPEAEAILKNFHFIPHTRLDDLMVSFATDGSGVGPHFDSYDVFLLQGSGKRLWQISSQTDQSLLPNAPLRILKHFQPEEEWLLEPGDMLYLPPNYAHNGIAVGESMTYSIGFRAFSHEEIVREFLYYLQDNLKIEGMYADPELTFSKHPAKISNEMVNKVSHILEKIRFTKKEIMHFLGTYLSEPKANVFFDSPDAPVKKKEFFKLAKKVGIRLHLKSQLLFTDNIFFMNGEDYYSDPSIRSFLIKLADERELIIPDYVSEESVTILYKWYLSGYIEINA